MKMPTISEAGDGNRKEPNFINYKILWCVKLLTHMLTVLAALLLVGGQVVIQVREGFRMKDHQRAFCATERRTREPSAQKDAQATSRTVIRSSD